jgi:hypothetical protein
MSSPLNQFDINAERIVESWLKRTSIEIAPEHTRITSDEIASLKTEVAKNLAMSAISGALDSAFVERAKNYIKGITDATKS